MAKMTWAKARKFRQIEEKYQPGKMLNNGRIVSNAPRDRLEAMARRAEYRWLKGRLGGRR